MSRQSKQTKTIALRKRITAMHKSGGKGPGRGEKLTKQGYRHNPEKIKRLAEFVAKAREEGRLR
jgi:hypothetical protein